MAQIETFGFDRARLVGIYQQEYYTKLQPLQLPLFIDDSLMMVLQLEDHVSRICFCGEHSQTNYETFMKKYDALSKEELKEACAIQDKDLFLSLPQLIHCVGCRRSVEHLFRQVQKLNHSVYESMCITQNGSLTISPNYMCNSKKLFHLFYNVRSKLYEVLDSLINSKKNKRCIFHSLKMQKPTDILADNKPSLPKWCSCSIMDVWDRMCPECHEEVATLECKGVAETMDNYLKKHRFCNECKSKVQKAFHILTGEIDAKTENGFCSAIYEGLHSCNVKSEKADTTKSRHIHICTERSYIVHMLTLAEPELLGAKKERHAKTIDVAQEEVCTCLALHLYQRLHKVWHQKLTFEQTWLTLFYLGIESIRQNFETYIEQKIGVGCVEALCEELAQAEKDKEIRMQKRKLRKKRQKKRKGAGVVDGKKAEPNLLNDGIGPTSSLHSNVAESNGKFHLCLLDVFRNNEDCKCADQFSESDSASELTREEILEFERNRSQINVQRSQLRERIRQNFENFCSLGITNGSDVSQ